MASRMWIIPYIACFLINCHAFYKPKTYKQITTFTPKSPGELRDLLCTKKTVLFMQGGCDNEPKKIILNKLFDFTDLEGSKEEEACQICPNSKWYLKSKNGCEGSVKGKVKYSIAGLTGLEVGSNKIIVGINGGGIKGKGLKLDKSTDVEIRNLVITDINAHVYQGGIAIEMVGAKNVLVDGNYFKNIGGTMVVSSTGSTTGVTISTNYFDGISTPLASCNDGTHTGVWRFAGDGDRVRVEHNSVHHVSGALVVSASKNVKTVVHLQENVFHDIKGKGVVNVEDKLSSVLAEGNVFIDVASGAVDSKSEGNVYMPQTEADELACETYIKRKCEMNTFSNSAGNPSANNMEVLKDIKVIYDADARFWTRWIFGPSRK